jgi:hypothetical protein
VRSAQKMTRTGVAGKGSGSKGCRGAEHGQACTKERTGAVAVRAALESAVQVGRGDAWQQASRNARPIWYLQPVVATRGHAWSATGNALQWHLFSTATACSALCLAMRFDAYLLLPISHKIRACLFLRLHEAYIPDSQAQECQAAGA